jgi:hypothetical protein
MWLDEWGTGDYTEGTCNVCHLPVTEHQGAAKWPHRRAALRQILFDGWI